MFKADIIGSLAADAEIREINSKRYITFSVSHNKYRKDEQGQKNEFTQWINVLWYGDSHNIFKYLKKGTKVFVRGHEDVRLYRDSNGDDGLSITINASEVVLCGLNNTGNE